MANKTWLLGCGVLAAFFLVGCGGGGGGTDFAGVASTGSAAIAFGPVTGFGSVIVNGVRYDTSHATFKIDGAVGTQADLDVGDVVTIAGTIDASGVTGTADTVTFDDSVEGPIAAIDRGASTLVVLGQTVIVDDDTSFDDSIRSASLASLVVGDVVEVSGLVASDGSIRATRIETKAAAAELEITGRVASHDAATKRFNINAQVVDYSAAALGNFPAGMVADGQVVEVKGVSIVAGVLQATRVEFTNDDRTADVGARAEIEGLVTRFVSATDFAVSGVAVTTNAQTTFAGGSPADLGLNVEVEVEGTVGAGGVLAASRVEIHREAPVRITAEVDSVNTVASSFVVLGITVRVDSLTRVEDRTSQHLRPFTLGILNVGDHVVVHGAEVPVGSRTVLATRLEREERSARVELRGRVETVVQPAFSVLGVTVNTGAGTDFVNVAGVSLDATQFFSQLATGSVVDVRGLEITPRAIQADEVELEN